MLSEAFSQLEGEKKIHRCFFYENESEGSRITGYVTSELCCILGVS
jgi:hypothetical protein